MYTYNPLIDCPITQYYFDTFIVGQHSSIPHLLLDLQKRRELALSELNDKLPIRKINELKNLIDMLEKKIATLPESTGEDLENAEPVYWINKLGRQSALEISTYGRIRPETMDLLMCLPEEDFVAAMSIAGRLSTKIQVLGEQALAHETNMPAAMPVVS